MMKSKSNLINKKRVFFSDAKDDNPLDSLVQKVKIAQLPSDFDPALKEKLISSSDLYCDMGYSEQFFTFKRINTAGIRKVGIDASSPVSRDIRLSSKVHEKPPKNQKSSKTMLDLYSGCGAMSTGLCLGAQLSGQRLVNRWAVDINTHACESLRKNHPETKVRNEAAEDFLCLLKEWQKRAKEYIDEAGKPIMMPIFVDEGETLNIKKMLPITLDSVHFKDSVLMLLAYGDKEPRRILTGVIFYMTRIQGQSISLILVQLGITQNVLSIII